MKKILLVFISFTCIIVNAQEINIVPAPVELYLKNDFKYENGDYPIFRNKSTVIVCKTIAEVKAAKLLQSYLKEYARIESSLKRKASPKDVFIELIEKKDSGKPEGYSLLSTGNSVIITGNDASGLFYGIQTFRQLLYSQTIPPRDPEGWSNAIPQLSITDYPRFPYRGMHFDVARHFSSVENVKKYIDYLAMHKFNKFHWHLTDDQGWRIEIKKYPLLTQIGGCRAQTLVGPYGSNKYDGKKHCGFYTQEEIKEVVKYATERFITVIPEIEMPGHALAALSSYNYLGCTKGPYRAAETWGVFDDVFCAGNDSTFIFLQNVLDEVMQLFPSKLIHIGGDESPKTRWKTCADCQRRISKEKLKDEHELQSYFIKRIEKYVNSKGRNIIGWDEILEGGLAPNAAVMSWRGEEGGIAAAKQHHPVVMTPGNYLYFDHAQSNNEDSVTFGGYNSLEKVYSYEPIPAVLSAEESKYILGAQANLWTEYITNPKKVEYQLFPRIAALSEVLWSPKEKRNWEDFERRLLVMLERYKQLGINFSKAYFEPVVQLSPTEKFEGIRLSVKTKQPDAKFLYGNQSESLFNLYYDSIHTVIQKSGKYAIRMLSKKANTKNREVEKWAQLSPDDYLFSSDMKIHYNKASGKKTTLQNFPSKSYSGSGAFTLVDGIQNNTGMSKSSQFLGFAGDDLEATIDLGTSQSISSISLRTFEQTASWIYRPQFVCFYTSDDGINYQLFGTALNNENERHLIYKFEKTTAARFIKVHAKNAGTIADGNPGAGNKAWLFADEIEVN